MSGDPPTPKAVKDGLAAFVDWDVPAGRILLSPAVATLLGGAVPARPVPIRWWRDRIHPEDVADLVSALEEALAGEALRWNRDYRLRRLNGRFVGVRERAFVVREGGRPLRVVSALSSLDGASAMERPSTGDVLAGLERSGVRFRTFVESIAQLAWTMTPDGWIDFYNRRWYDYTGTTFEEMEGWGWVQVHDPHDLPRMLRIWRRALSTGQPWEDEFRLRRADGEMRWHLSRAMPLRDRRGRIVRWFGTNTDVHDQKLALEERSRLLRREKQARRAAEEANRAKDEFLAIVSHELRSPLNAILGWARLLGQGRLSPEQRRQAVETIERNARQQGLLVEDLLDTSRILSRKLEIERKPVALGRPVKSAIKGILPEARERGVTVELRDETGGGHVLGDERRLEQIASNLLSNAVRFSRQGGRVEARILEEGKALLLTVRDEGEGIDPAFLPRLFQRFQQADSSTTRGRGGLGLGLSIVRELAELHGGEVSAHSEGKGTGATFTVRLPAADPSEEVLVPAPCDAEEARRPVSLRALSVLAVDDDPETRELLSTLLLMKGASVVTASSVAEALEVLRAGPPDVIVSDIAMPEVDGYGLVDRVRRHPDPEVATVPILALTAFASLQDRGSALAAGFDAYLEKPVDPEVLAKAIADLVRTRLVP